MENTKNEEKGRIRHSEVQKRLREERAEYSKKEGCKRLAEESIEDLSIYFGKNEEDIKVLDIYWEKNFAIDGCFVNKSVSPHIYDKLKKEGYYDFTHEGMNGSTLLCVY